MKQEDILLVNGNEVCELFKGHELEIINIVKEAYKTHSLGDSTLPHSSFLRFPQDAKNRIIALPAYLGGDFRTAGLKWISSFPDNINKDMERASAVLMLNAMDSGHVKAIMESSVISANRTAAGAAAAADCFLGDDVAHSIGLIGCGLINFETYRFLLAVRPEIEVAYIYDISSSRAIQFKEKCMALNNNIKIEIVNDINSIFAQSNVVALATTASTPHISDISSCPSNSIILHTSLRDFSEEVILACDNVVDDLDHVCRAQTSIHLTEQKVGNRDFVRCNIGDIYNGKALPRVENKVTMYSPFGLGVLDIALGEYIYKNACEQGKGMILNNFLPTNWLKRD